MAHTPTALTVTHNPDAARFEARVDGLLCQAAYRLNNSVLDIYHTGVPQALEGRGIAAQLVVAALQHARANGLKVRPTCSYVAVYLRRHPEWADVQQP
ncbi:acetyltransferase [Vitreoscilla filiformis]|jgi:predicted GNAT family acetyltransferase|uniref:Acetyltransferase n=1 Tax=Vitreoscilla filiformis TaxID=63 RepID=A0A221KFE0_VITFI|nr:GNAT family N-acetyltransferase [Vitreoscilla filiformis]ASM77695.1 acetyltransferase [Vitreoscilla filiformis]